ncbi:MAG: hypothetical protein KF819_26610 [Labilithrix sp.]|nr:hypothetical protein [Labilithrix sp.]
MSVERARIIKSANASTPASAKPSANARRITRLELEARARADEIVRGASARAEQAAASAAAEAREREIARVAAEVVLERIGLEAKMEREIERTIAIAVALAERLVGEAIAVEPARIEALAREALREARGARNVRIEAAPADVEALRALLATAGETGFEIAASEELTRGSLVVHTEIGRVDARLAPQLARLAEALREAMKAGS